MKQFLKTYKIHLLYFLFLAIVITFTSIFSYGYIVSGNMIFTPSMHLVGSRSVFNILEQTLLFLSSVFSSMLLQRLVIVSGLFLAGFSAYYVSSKFSKKGISIISGTIFIINPFVYELLLTGDWKFLLGMWIIPILFLLTTNFLASKKEEDLYKVIGIIAISAVFGKELFGLTVLLNAMLLMINLALKRSYSNKNIQYAILVSVLLVILLPFLSVFHQSNLVNDSNNSLWSIFSLQGSWGRNFIFKGIFDVGLFKGIFWYLVIFISLFSLFKNTFKKRYSKFHLLVFLMFLNLFLLIIGDNLLISFGIQPYLINAVSALIISLTFPIGIDELLEKLKFQKITIILTSFTLLFLASFPIFLGGLGQMKNVEFPQSYYELTKVVGSQSKILVLPWRQYEYYEWSETTLLNPASKFFEANVLFSSTKKVICDIEFTDSDFEVCLNYDDSYNIGRQVIDTLEIDYILINKTDGFVEISNLFPASEYNVLFEDEFSIVFEVN